jgi:hypothetical protein
LPPLAGIEVKVKLVPTPTGIALISEDDGKQITERRTLSQEDLQKIPRGLGVYRFINLRARSGEIYSCIIAGEDTQVFGNMRAFWWSLAKVQVRMIDVKARMTRMTPTALAHVHAAAREMWDTAIKEAHSIDLRDLVPGTLSDMILSSSPTASDTVPAATAGSPCARLFLRRHARTERYTPLSCR